MANESDDGCGCVLALLLLVWAIAAQTSSCYRGNHIEQLKAQQDVLIGALSEKVADK